MGNLGGRHITPHTFCKSRAFRAGWEDYRLGRPVRFDEWGDGIICYEKGRQCAALAAREGYLTAVPDKSRIKPGQVLVLRQWLQRLNREAFC